MNDIDRLRKDLMNPRYPAATLVWRAQGIQMVSQDPAGLPEWLLTLAGANHNNWNEAVKRAREQAKGA